MDFTIDTANVNVASRPMESCQCSVILLWFRKLGMVSSASEHVHCCSQVTHTKFQLNQRIFRKKNLFGIGIDNLIVK